MNGQAFEETQDKDLELQLGLEELQVNLTEQLKNQGWSNWAGRNLHYGLVSAGLESVDTGKLRSAWEAIKAVSNASAKVINEAWVSIGAWWDETGVRDIKQMEDVLASKSVENKAVIESRFMPRRLAVSGVLPADFQPYTADLIRFADHVGTTAVPAMASLNRKVMEVLRPASPQTAVEFHTEIMKIVHLVAANKRPEDHFTHQQLIELYPGDRTPFKPRAKRPIIHTHPKIHDAESLSIRDALEKIEHTLFLDGFKGRAEAKSNRLPVLNLSECAVLLEQCRKLSARIIRLKELAKVYKSDVSSRSVAMCMALVVAQLDGDIEMDADGQQWDTSVRVDSDDLARAEWVEMYFRDQLTDHRLLLVTTTRILITVFDAYKHYILASLKYHR